MRTNIRNSWQSTNIFSEKAPTDFTDYTDWLRRNNNSSHRFHGLAQMIAGASHWEGRLSSLPDISNTAITDLTDKKICVICEICGRLDDLPKLLKNFGKFGETLNFVPL